MVSKTASSKLLVLPTTKMDVLVLRDFLARGLPIRLSLHPVLVIALHDDVAWQHIRPRATSLPLLH